MSDREVTRVLPDGRVASGENADMIAIANGDSSIDANDDGDDEEFASGIDNEEMSPDNPDAYPHEFDGAGDNSEDKDEAGDRDDDAEDDDGDEGQPA